MGMMFGGSAEEEDAKSLEEKAWDKGVSEGIARGRLCTISRCQLTISQSLILTHAQKTQLWNELEKLRE